jgi:hypothetical protein
MKTFLFSLFFSLSVLLAQTPGTVSQSTVSNVVGTAGPVVCTLTNSSPALPSGVHVVCTNAGAVVLTLDAVVVPGTNGLAGHFGVGGDSVTWLVNQPSGQTMFSWQMAANGVSKQGAF